MDVDHWSVLEKLCRRRGLLHRFPTGVVFEGESATKKEVRGIPTSMPDADNPFASRNTPTIRLTRESAQGMSVDQKKIFLMRQLAAYEYHSCGGDAKRYAYTMKGKFGADEDRMNVVDDDDQFRDQNLVDPQIDGEIMDELDIEQLQRAGACDPAGFWISLEKIMRQHKKAGDKIKKAKKRGYYDSLVVQVAVPTVTAESLTKEDFSDNDGEEYDEDDDAEMKVEEGVGAKASSGSSDSDAAAVVEKLTSKDKEDHDGMEVEEE